MDTFSIAQRIILFMEQQLVLPENKTLLDMINEIKLILDEEISEV